MSYEQCWCVQADGSRCPGTPQPGALFCSRHRSINAAEVSRIWRAPEAEMPPELVAAMRRYEPALTFPAPPTALPEEVSHPLTPSPPHSLSPPPSLEWLLATLQEVMTGVTAGDATPLQKANAVARLAGHFLKAYRAKELEQANKELARRAATLEARVAELEARAVPAAKRLPEAPPIPPAVEDAPPEPAHSLLLPDRNAEAESLAVPADLVVTLDGGEPLAARSVIGDVSDLTADVTDTDRGSPGSQGDAASIHKDGQARVVG